MAVVSILRHLLLTHLRNYSILFCIVFPSLLSFSQNSEIDKLKKLRIQYTKDIENAQKLLEQKDKSRNNSLNDLDILNSKIKSQESVINTYKKEIDVISAIIDTNQQFVDHLGDDINYIKNGYEKLILEAKNKSKDNFSELMLIFSSSSFSEAYRRFTLMKQYSAYRRKQGLVLIDTKQKYDSILLVNKNILVQKTESVTKLSDELDNLRSSIDQKQKFLNSLKNDENRIRSEIQRKIKVSKELELNIEKLIAEANSEHSSYTYSNFSKAKGNLNWPVTDGIVTSVFGEHNHAVLKGVKVKNNGVDITVDKNNAVKSVYEGAVSRVIAIPGYNKAVILRHGKYITVYANLVNVFVKNGDLVKSNQEIGKVYADKNSDNGILHFEIWEENKKIDPISWLKR